MAAREQHADLDFGGARRVLNLPDASDPQEPATKAQLDAAIGGLDKSDVGLGNVTNDAQLPLTGGTMSGAITLAADPASAMQAATKQYVDGLALNIGKRSRVRVATTANITISTALNAGDTLNGVVLADGDLVLVKDQSSAAQNGIYVAGASPTRSPEYDSWAEYPGSLVAVAEGTTSADTIWLCTSNDGGTLGSTAITFSQTTATGALLASNNLSDIPNAGAARTNLGLGDSATKNTGTSNGTVAAGDDSRITGAAQKASNLSDLANAATARSNIGLGNVDNTSDATKNAAPATLTNKRITPRVTSETSSATPTINTDNSDFHRITALAVNITSFTTNLSGTPTHGQKLIVEITGTATRTISWGSSFESSTATLPTTTVSTATLLVGFVWNSATSKWRCVAVA
jgi:hypothetical protein